MMTTRACANSAMTAPRIAPTICRHARAFNSARAGVLIDKADHVILSAQVSSGGPGGEAPPGPATKRSGHTMQIDLLDTFLDLAETRSYHRTAERLRVTQSTVSARVTALEQAVGSRLFNRSRAGTDLTPEGKRFEPHARALRHEWNEAKRRIQIPQGAAQLLRLGIQNDLAAVYLGDWVAEFRAALPETAFYIEPDYSNQMCADLLTGILDFAVMFSPNPHPDLHFESVGEVTYRMVSTETARLAEVRPERFVFAHFSPAFEEMHRQTDARSCHLAGVGRAVRVGRLAADRRWGGRAMCWKRPPPS